MGKIFKIISRKNEKHSKVVFMCVSKWVGYRGSSESTLMAKIFHQEAKKKKKKIHPPSPPIDSALPFHFLPNRHLWCILESLPLCKWSSVNWSADASLVCYTPKKVPYPLIYKVHLSLTLLLLETRANAEGQTIFNSRLEKSGNGAGGRGY